MSNSFDFEQKLLDTSKGLLSFALNLTKNMDDAKDLLQETSIRVISNKEKFNPGTNFKAWSFTIMKNIFINNYRKQRKANTVFDSSENNFLLDSGDTVVRNGGEENVLSKELANILGKLDDSIKVPFLMHFEGFKYQEIADELNLPLGTVKSRIFFARKELKELLKDNYHNDLVASYQAVD